MRPQVITTVGVDIFRLYLLNLEWLSKSQNVISIQTAGTKGGRSKPIKAFTEQGIYMLMTILKGNPSLVLR